MVFPGKRVTMRDVAGALGCSHATVSMALHDSPLLPERTRQRVVRQARTMGYLPNQAARQLKSSRSDLIGLLTDDHYAATRAAFVPALEAALLPRGYRLFPVAVDSQAQSVQARMEELLSRQVDGIVAVVGGGRQAACWKAGKRRPCPMVFALGIESGARPYDYITVDRREGVYQGIRHLLRLGHRAIGFPYGPGERIYTPPKLAGYRQALEEYGVPDPDAYLYPVEFRAPWIRAGYEFGEWFLRQTRKPTALFLPAAQVTLGVFGRLRRAGVRIPEDVAVVGYENMEEADWLEVAITTVGIPALEMAQQVTATMLERLDGGRGPRRHVVLDHCLTIRESCGTRPRTTARWEGA